MKYKRQTKAWIREITEISLLLVILAIVIEILFTKRIPLLTGTAGLIVLNIMFVLFRRKTISNNKTT